MLVDNKNFKEAEHIGEDLLQQANLAMYSKCRSVERTLANGVFTLEKALKLYKVPEDTYYTFVAKNLAAKIDSEVNTKPVEELYIAKINIFEKLLHLSFSQLMDVGAFEKILTDIKNESTKVKSGKISLKEKVTSKSL